MCGLVGMVGELNVQHEKCVRTLLILDSVRGEDSTGVAVVQKGNAAVKIAKQVGDPFQLFDHKSYDKAFTGLQRVIIGHNRYATSGAVRRDTAHPFENDSYVGVHNGTLKNKWRLADHNSFLVDSENLYHHMHKHGMKDLLDTMDGAWALVWWDKENSTINFLRNQERPLYMTYSKDEKCLFWASEHWMLFAALSKHNLEYGKIEMMPQDVHISIPVSLQGVLGQPVAKLAKSTYVPPVHHNTSHTSHTPPKSNVVDIAKKEEPAAATQKKPVGHVETAQVSSYDNYYIRSIQRKLELLNISKDIHGARYISCFDPGYDSYEIRLYPSDEHIVWEMIGQDIMADIGGWNGAGSIAGRGYYRVNPERFRVIVPEIEEKEEEKIIGPLGKWMDRAEFKRKHSQCDYCSQPLEFGANNRFTTAGECMCPSCSTNPEVTPYVNFH